MELNLGDPEQIKQLIAVLQNLLPKDQNTQPSTNDEPKVPDHNIKTKTRKLKAEHYNKFDDMAESSMHKSDSLIDKKLSVHPPSPRTRQFETVDVKCRSCGKDEKINPVLLPDSTDRYKCNKCSTMAGE
jgi:hypothetical protein